MRDDLESVETLQQEVVALEERLASMTAETDERTARREAALSSIQTIKGRLEKWQRARAMWMLSLPAVAALLACSFIAGTLIVRRSANDAFRVAATARGVLESAPGQGEGERCTLQMAAMRPPSCTYNLVCGDLRRSVQDVCMPIGASEISLEVDGERVVVRVTQSNWIANR